jgi:hypothetical protein
VRLLTPASKIGKGEKGLLVGQSKNHHGVLGSTVPYKALHVSALAEQLESVLATGRLF